LRQGRDARGPRFVAQQAGHAFGSKPLLPSPYAWLALAGPPHGLGGTDPLGHGQDDPRPPGVLLRTVPIRHDHLQTGTVRGSHLDLDPLAHPQNVGMPAIKRNHPLDAIH